MLEQEQRTAATHRLISAPHGNAITGYTVINRVPKDDRVWKTARWSEVEKRSATGSNYYLTLLTHRD
jgi:hypothetical protein